MEEELSRILSFWSSKAIDNRNGGFIGRIDHSGKKDWEAQKGVVLNTRILWTFSAAYRITGMQKYREIADRAYEEVVVEEWTYNFGPRRLMRQVIFENGFVRSIKQLGYGYP